MPRAHLQFSPQQKANAVLQVLKGNDVNQVAKELDVSVERLNRWKDLFVEGGKAALEERSHENTALARRRRQRQKIVQWALIIVALIIGLAALIRFVTSIRSGVGESS
jgi:transposase-like protein